MLEIIFWISTALVLYTYGVYPLWMAAWAAMFEIPVAKSKFNSPVAFVLAVHNEIASIQAKLENLLALTNPGDDLEILVVSDASTDGTDEIVAKFADRGVKLLRVEPRQGKHYAQKQGIDATSADIIAFTDAAPVLAPDALRELIDNFSDPRVGCVSSRDQVLGMEDEMSKEGDYIDYDMTLRLWESRVSSATGMSGSFFAARRSLCESWWQDRSSDFFMALETVRQGYRAVLDPDSIHYYTAAQSLGVEYRRKRRTVLNGLVVFFNSLDLINPMKYGMYSIQLVSHKLFRWLVPWALLAILVSSSLLASGSWFFGAALAGQLAFYAMAVFGCLFQSNLTIPFIRSAAFFAVSNTAALIAWMDLVSGQTATIWQPTSRP